MNTPTLRFKEFSGEWEVKKLKDISQLITKGTTPKKFIESGIHFIKIECFNGDLINKEKCAFIDELTHSTELKRSILQEGDILFAIAGATIGKCNVITSDILPANTNQALAIVRLKQNENIKYVYHLLSSQKMEKYIIDNISVGAQPNLNLEQMGSFSFSCPSLPEQTKIANFLIAIDEKIAQLSQTAQLLTDYKKGVMQQIFSQQLRFKDDDGREFDEWDFIELEKIASKVNTKNKDCSITNVLTNSATQGVVNQADYFDRDIANQNNLGGYYIVEIDDFVYNPRISNHALVGSLKRNNLVKGVMSPLYTVFKFKNGSLSFFEQYFETTFWHDYMKSVANSGARHDRLNITNNDFLNLPVPFPSLPEQTKIANFLTAIDDKINNNQTQLDAMKQYKSGLLQQMFV